MLKHCKTLWCHSSAVALIGGFCHRKFPHMLLSDSKHLDHCQCNEVSRYRQAYFCLPCCILLWHASAPERLEMLTEKEG